MPTYAIAVEVGKVGPHAVDPLVGDPGEDLQHFADMQHHIAAG